jgi:hypothetical protein
MTNTVNTYKTSDYIKYSFVEPLWNISNVILLFLSCVAGYEGKSGLFGASSGEAEQSIILLNSSFDVLICLLVQD